MDQFFKRLNILIHRVRFIKLCLYKILWNFTSTKFQVFLICIIFFSLGKIDQTTFLIACGIYAGANVLEGVKIGKNKD